MQINFQTFETTHGLLLTWEGPGKSIRLGFGYGRLIVRHCVLINHNGAPYHDTLKLSRYPLDQGQAETQARNMTRDFAEKMAPTTNARDES